MGDGPWEMGQSGPKGQPFIQPGPAGRGTDRPTVRRPNGPTIPSIDPARRRMGASMCATSCGNLNRQELWFKLTLPTEVVLTLGFSVIPEGGFNATIVG
jgi:hypothetical protein